MRMLDSVTLLGIDCIDIDRLIRAADICKKDFAFANVKLLTSIDSDHPDVVKIPHIGSIEAYSRFVIEELDGYVDTEHVLMIQYDGFILNPGAWSDEFLKYDYVGAPWYVGDVYINDFGFPESLRGQLVVGNGGFCLRSKRFTSLCATLAKQGMFGQYHPEDTVLCVQHRKTVEGYGVRFAPPSLAKRFSFEFETDDAKAWDGQFGFHGAGYTDISKWTKDHPEYALK
jgi:hypothetical protein